MDPLDKCEEILDRVMSLDSVCSIRMEGDDEEEGGDEGKMGKTGMMGMSVGAPMDLETVRQRLRSGWYDVDAPRQQAGSNTRSSLPPHPVSLSSSSGGGGPGGGGTRVWPARAARVYDR